MQRFWRSVALCLLGGVGLVSLTFICYRLHYNLATAGFLYVIVVVLVSRAGNFVSSIIISIIAVCCLAYLAPPFYSFSVDDPLDVVAILAFLTTSVVIGRMVSTLRTLMEEALSSVSHRVIEAEEQERQRLANDLHEDIGQRLSLLAIELDQLEKDTPQEAIEVRGRIDGVRKQILGVLTDVKALAHELYSPRLEYLDIALVMRSFCAEFGERKGIQIDFRSSDLQSPVPPDISLCLFRVLQEALRNALKHSGVRHFDVQLHGTSDEIHLTVGEYGAGFNFEVARKGPGLGLNHMQERLKLVSGILSIDSQPKRGATIHARVPLNPKRNSVLPAEGEGPKVKALHDPPLSER